LLTNTRSPIVTVSAASVADAARTRREAPRAR
jgi:hypothetical protein